MSKITFSKTWYGSLHINLFNKIDIMIGTMGGWGIGFDFDWHERAITFNLVKVYVIVEKHWDLQKISSFYLAVDPDETQDEE